ncbi:YhdP family protein [Andreprevotia lacus]|jgi:uncharacterized protein (TIGR02099 family)|nr:YhdP family protein [Andreprevotia lacus]
MTFTTRIRAAARIVNRVLAWHSRLLLRLLLAVLALLLIIALTWQFYLLPRLDQFRPAIVKAIADASGANLSVRHLSGGWAGFFPRLLIEGVTVRDAQQQPRISIDAIDAELSWSSIVLLSPNFHSLTLNRPRLSVLRDRNDIWHVGGFALTGKPGNDNRFVDWLLEQGNLAIADGEIEWQDQLGDEPAQRLTDVRITTSKFFRRHRFSLAVTPPATLASPLEVEGNWYGGTVAEWRQWHGVLTARMSRVELARASRWLPAALQGRVAWHGQGGGEASFTFKEGRAERFQLGLHGNDLQGQFQGHVMRLPAVDMRLQWYQQHGTQNLEVQGNRIEAASGVLCDHCSIALTQSGEQDWKVEARDWRLAPLGEFLPLLPAPWGERMSKVVLGGTLKQLQLQHAAEGYEGVFSGQGLRLAGYPDVPTLAGVDAEARFDTRGGQLQLTSKQFQLDYPPLFSEVLQFRQLKLDVDWQRTKEGVRAEFKRIQLQNDDVATTLAARYTSTASGPGYLDLNGDLQRLRASRVPAYLPKVVGPDTLHWLRQALGVGEAYDGKVALKGDLAQFPFPADKGGVFRVTAQVRDTALKYAEGWPMIEGIAGELDFHGTRMEIHGRDAHLLGTRLSNVSAVIPDLDSFNPLLQIDGQVRGPTREFLRFLRASPIHERTDGYLGDLKAEGEGDLLLRLDLPLANIDAARIAGQYRFLNNQLDFGENVPRLAGANGRVNFTEKQLQISEATAQSLGGPLRVSGGTDAAGALKLQLAGQAQLGDVVKRFELPLASRMRGPVAYQGVLTAGGDNFELALQSPLQGATLDLPAPLGKNAADTRQLRVKVGGGKGQTQIDFAYDTLLQGVLARRNGVLGGQIALGRAAQASGQPGISVVGGWSDINADIWRKLLDDGKGGNDAAVVSSVDVSFPRAIVHGYVLNELGLKLHAEGAQWLGEVSSREFAGKLNWNGQGRGKLAANLTRLYLPLQEDTAAATPTPAPGGGARAVPTQSTLPALDLHVDDFRYKALQLGKLDVDAAQQGEIWRLNNVVLNNPDGKLTMSGLWRQRPSRSRVEGKININTDNLGKLLTRLDYPDTMKRAPAQFSGDLAWEGELFPPDLSTLEGSLKLDVQAGQFSKIAPGAGRFLSILSLQSLSRRVQLDFRDVFSEGFEFDTIKGEAVIQRGQAHTENLIISGPAAQVLFRGDANFVAGTQNLRVRIVPTVGDSVAVATTLINPIAGAAAFLLQRILKDPLGQLVAYEYDITGSMRDPQIAPAKQTLTDRLREVKPH